MKEVNITVNVYCIIASYYFNYINYYNYLDLIIFNYSMLRLILQF